MSTKLKKLSMLNDKGRRVENTSPKSPPSTMFMNSPAIEFDYLSANWANSNHLLILKELKQKDLTSRDKEQFLELSKQEKLRNVVYDHASSALKMVYVNTCLLLGTNQSVDFFKNGSKDKERVYEFLWKNASYYAIFRTSMCHHMLRGLFYMPIFIIENFQSHVILTETKP